MPTKNRWRNNQRHYHHPLLPTRKPRHFAEQCQRACRPSGIRSTTTLYRRSSHNTPTTGDVPGNANGRAATKNRGCEPKAHAVYLNPTKIVISWHTANQHWHGRQAQQPSFPRPELSFRRDEMDLLMGEMAHRPLLKRRRRCVACCANIRMSPAQAFPTSLSAGLTNLIFRLVLFPTPITRVSQVLEIRSLRNPSPSRRTRARSASRIRDVSRSAASYETSKMQRVRILGASPYAPPLWCARIPAPTSRGRALPNRPSDASINRRCQTPIRNCAAPVSTGQGGEARIISVLVCLKAIPAFNITNTPEVARGAMISRSATPPRARFAHLRDLLRIRRCYCATHPHQPLRRIRGLIGPC
jgi:hypothetical protein